MGRPAPQRLPNQQDTTQTSTVGNTADIEAARNFSFTQDPTTPYIYGNERRAIKQTYHNPLGAYRTPYMQEAGLKADLADSADRQAVAMQGDHQRLQQQQFGQRMGLAELTAPRTTMGHSSGFTSVPGQPGFWSQLALSAAQGAGAAATTAV